MRGIPSSFLTFFFVFVFLMELISYFGFRTIINRSSEKIKTYLTIGYILFSIISTSLVLYSFSNPDLLRQSRNYTFFFWVISITILNMVPKTFYAITTLSSFLIKRLLGHQRQLIFLTGSSLIASGIFIVIASGIFWGRHNLNIEKHDLNLENFPQQLDGLKIVQLSDIHLGSFGQDPKVLKSTANLIKQIQPDLLLFTGDIVNNFSNEIDGFELLLKQLPAKYGKFAILGNHDYGDYSTWPDSIHKKQNLDQIKNGLVQAGFKLLLNQWEKVNINDTSIYVVGVENWGHPPFPQYARLDQATNNLPPHAFQILLTHDPAHWKAKIEKKTTIPLTLSGHTHGGQFGIKIAGIEFSPICLYQKIWGGLYQSENQFIYVNRGLGTIGFPGRIEMQPEITVLTLHPSKKH